MTPGRQRAKSLQWESDLGLQHRSRPERMSLLPKNPRRRARIFTMPEIGIGYPYERWESRHLGFKADLHESPSPPERCRSYSADGRIISYGGKVQTQRRTQPPPAQSTEPATGRKGDRKSKSPCKSTKSVCTRCQGTTSTPSVPSRVTDTHQRKMYKFLPSHAICV
jgi:hypothetical protein